MDTFEWTDKQGDTAEAYIDSDGSEASGRVAGIYIKPRTTSDHPAGRAVWLDREAAASLRDWLDTRLRETQEAPARPTRSGRQRAQWGDLHLFGYHCRVYNETVDLALSPHTDGSDLVFVPGVRITPEVDDVIGRLVLKVDTTKAIDAIDAYQTRTGR